MTRTKVWRLSLAAILGFGWLFLTPAYSDDPLSLAAKEIEKLNASVSDLTYKTEFKSLINIAESKYDAAVTAKQQMDDASDSYDSAVLLETSAQQYKIEVQNLVNNQSLVVESALTNKNNAQDELDAAIINLSTANSNLQNAQSVVDTAGSAGLQYTVYNLLREGSVAVPGSVICSGAWNSNSMYLPVCGRYENIIVKFTGVITVPSYWTSTYFAGYTDDGFRMYVDGSLAVNNWVEQGARWSAYSPVYDVSEDKTLNVEIWWYNGGGPGSYHLGWAIPGGWTGAGCDYTGGWGVGFSCDLNTFSSGSQPTQQQLDNLFEAQQEQAVAQQAYNSKLEVRNDKLNVYNQEVQTLQNLTSNLILAEQNLTISQENLTSSLEAKNISIDLYNQSIIDLNLAIDNAWQYYEEQLKREIAIAIAQAIANQPQPTPETTVEPEPSPSIEPSQQPEPTPEPSSEPNPSPSPEQTKPEDPTPSPDPEITNEATPSPSSDPEPSPEPSPQPTGIGPSPSSEPNPTPTQPSENLPPKNNTTEDLSNVIANLTSKDNKVVKLTPEQMSAVGNTLASLSQEAKQEVASELGIKSSEISIIAEAAKSNPVIAAAVIEFSSRAEENTDSVMPYTLADVATEIATEQFLSDPLGSLTNIDFEKLLSPSEWGKDMTDDQREKAQEVVVPVIIASNIVAAAMTRRI